MARYLVKTGMNYGPANTRAEPGDVVDDLPGESVRWLREQGHIETDLSDLTKAELREKADEAGLDLPASATKDEILDALREAPGPEDDDQGGGELDHSPPPEEPAEPEPEDEVEELEDEV